MDVVRAKLCYAQLLSLRAGVTGWLVARSHQVSWTIGHRVVVGGSVSVSSKRVQKSRADAVAVLD